MKLFKGFVIAIAGLFIVVTLLSLLMPSTVLTARSVVIQSSSSKIMDQVKDFQNWKNWHPLFKHQKNIMISITSPGNKKCAEWESDNKKHSLIMTDTAQNYARLIFQTCGENDMLNKIELINFKDSNNIQVEWSAVSQLKWYPWEKFSGIFIDKMSGPGYEAALNDLKYYVENN